MIFDGQTLKVETLENGIVELRFERAHEAVNKLDRLAFDELRQALTAIGAYDSLKGVLVASAKEAFVVGADIFEFSSIFAQSEEEIAGFVRANSAIVTMLSELPAPSVAAINGLALGGGFELALAADYRAMANAAKVGFPEIHLGLFPGYGGTVRLPRLIGLAKGAEWIASGAQQSAETALAAGAVDAMIAPEELRASALALLEQAIEDKLDWRRCRSELKKSLPLSQEEISAQLAPAKASAAKALPHYPAAHLSVELLESNAGLERDAALELEAKTFAKAAKTQAAASLVTIFINEQALKKIARNHAKAAAPVTKAAVVGAGVMGGGIAYQSAARGAPIIMKDIAEKALELGIAEVRKLLARQVETGRLAQGEADEILHRITPSLTYEGFKDVDVVIEAVVENLAVKQTVLAELENATSDGAIIASNTSSLRIGDLTEGLRRPENFLGMHFFNPVPKMALVEVVRGPKTSEQAIATVVGFAAAMGKTPIVMEDCPGFVVNRTLAPYFIAFLKLVRDGVHFTKIDKAMESFGWPMGPAYLIDVIGMDISHHLIEIIAAGFPERIRVGFETAINVLLRAGRLGQKNGHGFYKYAPDAKGRPRKEADPETDRLLAGRQSRAPIDIGGEEIVERMMLPLIFEAARCFEDGVVTSPGEVDMCLLLGLGLPRYLGGALKYADYLGLSNIIARAQKSASLGEIYSPSEAFLARAAKGEAFYPI